MPQSGHFSFRKILLLRILLLSIPILLLGEAVTLRKARTSLLNTARQNLTESATRKADNIHRTIQSLEGGLLTATETQVLKAGSPQAVEAFLPQLEPRLPTQIDCIQLIDAKTEVIAASTCEHQQLNPNPARSWLDEQNHQALEQPGVYLLSVGQVGSRSTAPSTELNIVLGAPVYEPSGQLRYILKVHAVLSQLENIEPKSLLGYTVVIDQDNVVLAHPYVDQVGEDLKLDNSERGERLRDIINNAQGGDSDVRHLFSFGPSNQEWLAGYNSVTVAISPDEERNWTVLAVTRLDHALFGLEDIKQVLLILTLGLVAALTLSALYVARDLSLPIEQLGNYALRIQDRPSSERVPRGFKIRELNYLASALDNMVQRLGERARELEAAWQEAEAANQLKSEFLANTSHELRTPLNAIIGCIRLVQDGCCDDPQEERDFLQRADNAAIHLLKVINDILDIAKIEAGTLSLAIEPVDLKEILSQVIDLQIVQIQQKGLKLIYPDLKDPILVEVDRAKLKQVFLNIIYNAIKFTDQGSITITTQIKTSKEPQKSATKASDEAVAPPAWVVVTVRDTGIGIDPAQQHKLFRPFVMADGSTTRKFEGTGLGLAISKNLVVLMKGRINLHSLGIGYGTTIEITLPISQERINTGRNIIEPQQTAPDSKVLAAQATSSDLHNRESSTQAT
ncbi:MAG: two-component sensor histidine kinase [Cyanothece sp. SIO1E1]|nr:two-component sensor histidine kinase [Cyanothece sp. SIO1E1]